jgi:septal ring factor EnvC (AmiA/AmiB activator)
MKENEIEKLEQIRQMVTVLVTDAIANRQAELQAANKELTERNRLLDIQIKAKETTLRGINAAAKAMFASPEQPADATVDVAKDMAGFEEDEV